VYLRLKIELIRNNQLQKNPVISAKHPYRNMSAAWIKTDMVVQVQIIFRSCVKNEMLVY